MKKELLNHSNKLAPILFDNPANVNDYIMRTVLEDNKFGSDLTQKPEINTTNKMNNMPVVWRIMALKDVYILIPRTYDYVTLPGKRNFANVIKLKTWR